MRAWPRCRPQDHELVSLVHRTVVYELITAAQAIDMRERWPLGRGPSPLTARVRDHVPMLREVRGGIPTSKVSSEPSLRVSSALGCQPP